MFRIGKTFTWAAAHHLEGLPPEHQCSRVHGHNYTAEVIVTAPSLDERGFVVDFGDLGALKVWIDATWDHRDLNDVVRFNPTAEHLAAELWRQAVIVVAALPGIARVERVRVWETPTSWAEWVPPRESPVHLP